MAAANVVMLLVTYILAGCGSAGSSFSELAISNKPAAEGPALSLDAELEKLQTFSALEGVDADVFAVLKDELARVLGEQGVERFVSAPPMAESSQAPLSWDEGTSTLSWGYYSTGDYNQDSLVSINDITPLGQNYLAEVPGDMGSVLAVVDSEGDTCKPSSLPEVNGQSAIAFRDITDNCLMYAYYNP